MCDIVEWDAVFPLVPKKTDRFLCYDLLPFLFLNAQLTFYSLIRRPFLSLLLLDQWCCCYHCSFHTLHGFKLIESRVVLATWIILWFLMSPNPSQNLMMFSFPIRYFYNDIFIFPCYHQPQCILCFSFKFSGKKCRMLSRFIV